MPDFLTKERQTGRQCGPCQACCEVFGVIEIGKPPREPCKHQCAAGCAVYAERPPSCKSFECLWIAGAIDGDEKYRPDVFGIIFTWNNHNTSIGPYVQCDEVWPGAADGEKFRYVLGKVSRKTLVLVKTAAGGRRFVGPADRIAKTGAVLEAIREDCQLFG